MSDPIDSITVTVSATFEYDAENFDDLDTLQAEAMALDAIHERQELLTSEFDVNYKTGDDAALAILNEMRNERDLNSDEYADISQTIHYLKNRL